MAGMNEFKKFSKIARLSRECIITEKIDGTNAQVFIGEDGEFLVGSRTRWITPENDNSGFAKWAMEHKDELMTLGKGRHFGEWWGQGIQRNYGLNEKRFSMYNVTRWCLHNTTPKQIPTGDPRQTKMQEVLPPCCGLVPIIWKGMFDTVAINDSITDLARHGSWASVGFMKPEGVVVYHIAGNVMFKKTIEKDDEYKGKSI